MSELTVAQSAQMEEFKEFMIACQSSMLNRSMDESAQIAEAMILKHAGATGSELSGLRALINEARSWIDGDDESDGAQKFLKVIGDAEKALALSQENKNAIAILSNVIADNKAALNASIEAAAKTAKDTADTLRSEQNELKTALEQHVTGQAETDGVQNNKLVVLSQKVAEAESRIADMEACCQLVKSDVSALKSDMVGVKEGLGQAVGAIAGQAKSLTDYKASQTARNTEQDEAISALKSSQGMGAEIVTEAFKGMCAEMPDVIANAAATVRARYGLDNVQDETSNTSGAAGSI